jgi:hypothetical protein
VRIGCNKRLSTPLFAVFLGGPLHGSVTALAATRVRKAALQIEAIMTGYRLEKELDRGVERQEYRCFYIAESLEPKEVRGLVKEFWSAASPVPRS